MEWTWLSFSSSFHTSVRAFTAERDINIKSASASLALWAHQREKLQQTAAVCQRYLQRPPWGLRLYHIPRRSRCRYNLTSDSGPRQSYLSQRDSLYPPSAFWVPLMASVSSDPERLRTFQVSTHRNLQRFNPRLTLWTGAELVSPRLPPSVIFPPSRLHPFFTVLSVQKYCYQWNISSFELKSAYWYVCLFQIRIPNLIFYLHFLNTCNVASCHVVSSTFMYVHPFDVSLMLTSAWSLLNPVVCSDVTK